MNIRPTWMKRHSETVGLLFVLAVSMLLGIGLGFVLIVLFNLLRMW